MREITVFVIYRTDGCFYHPGCLIPWSERSPNTHYKLPESARRKARELRSVGHDCDVEDMIIRVNEHGEEI